MVGLLGAVRVDHAYVVDHLWAELGPFDQIHQIVVDRSIRSSSDRAEKALTAPLADHCLCSEVIHPADRSIRSSSDRAGKALIGKGMGLK